MKKQLNTEQLEAIKKYADSHGRQWKWCLNAEWQRGCCGLMDQAYAVTLLSIRNQFGPTWLQRFNIKKATNLPKVEQDYSNTDHPCDRPGYEHDRSCF
jgi:hypothetical protein